MCFIDFWKKIKEIFEKHGGTVPAFSVVDANSFFINKLEEIASSEAEGSLKMTSATILFEGFYRHIEEIGLKKLLLGVRVYRWSNHFGTPTVPFLLSYKEQINVTKRLFDERYSLNVLKKYIPWFDINPKFVMDHDNRILVDPKSIAQVAVPLSRGVRGTFTKTHNPSGGFTMAACDPVSLKFINEAASIAEKGGRVLEIGAAFGAATLEVLAKGASVFCNDINAENLAVVRTIFSEKTSPTKDFITGDDERLVIIPAAFPEELIGLPRRSFNAILLCRILHFLTGKKIEDSLALLSDLLIEGGKIYIVCETPYLRNWQRFIPEFHRRIEQGMEWPGEISNPAEYESSGRAASLPNFVHWLSKEILERVLSKAGFAIEYSDYIDRTGQFPHDLLMPEYGKESVGIIGVT
jgi:hypothetical protein